MTCVARCFVFLNFIFLLQINAENCQPNQRLFRFSHADVDGDGYLEPRSGSLCASSKPSKARVGGKLVAIALNPSSRVDECPNNAKVFKKKLFTWYDLDGDNYFSPTQALFCTEDLIFKHNNVIYHSAPSSEHQGDCLEKGTVRVSNKTFTAKSVGAKLTFTHKDQDNDGYTLVLASPLMLCPQEAILQSLAQTRLKGLEPTATKAVPLPDTNPAVPGQNYRSNNDSKDLNIKGCTDPSSSNFIINAGTDDGSCLKRCLDTGAINYWAEAECRYEQELCTDQSAANFGAPKPCVPRQISSGTEEILACTLEEEEGLRRQVEIENSQRLLSENEIKNLNSEGLDLIFNAFKEEMCDEPLPIKKSSTKKNLNIVFNYENSLFPSLGNIYSDAIYYTDLATKMNLQSQTLNDSILANELPAKEKQKFLESLKQSTRGVYELWLNYSGHGVTSNEGRFLIGLPIKELGDPELAGLKDAAINNCSSPAIDSTTQIKTSMGLVPSRDSIKWDINKAFIHKCQRFECSDFVVSAEEILSVLSASGVRNLFLNIDSCHSGAFAESLQYSNLKVVSMMSSSSCQLSYMADDGSNSLFRATISEFLGSKKEITDINKNKQISMAELLWSIHNKSSYFEIENNTTLANSRNLAIGSECQLVPTPLIRTNVDNTELLHRVILDWSDK